NNIPVPTLATDELQAAASQQAPIALVPLTDPMTLNNNNASAQKTNLYRRGSDQPPINANDAATNGSGTTYCQMLVGTAGLTRIKNEMPITLNAVSPAPAMANSLFTFLAMRFAQSYTNLGCMALLNNAPNPVALTMDGNGVVTAATITLPGAAAAGGTANGGANPPAAQAATGTATINLNANAGTAAVTLNVTYANHPNAAITANITDAAGKTVFTQNATTDNNSQATVNGTINGLQGLTALPNNWVFTVADPNMNNTVVGTGAVMANGVTATATLGAATPPAMGTPPTAGTTPVAGTPPATGTPAATGTTVTSPAAPASAGQVTPTNAPYNKVHKKKHHMW
ncbi:MAG: hypothetical protein JO011_17275, partial [Ktedonobacteraceae bacterium]|nr:hypothetical protein [Ktedonobacteraceae bacterium]